MSSSSKLVNVLVDYANIDLKFKSRGVLNLVEFILSLISENIISFTRRVRVRFYGGWYNINSPTREAEYLVREINRSFPRNISITTKALSISLVNVSTELAYSIEAEPGKHLLHTYRTRGCTNIITADYPNKHGCNDPICPLVQFASIIQTNRCPNGSCTIKPLSLLIKGEQKLVDAMIIADLIHLSGLSDPICVVSSDDDIWPGIKMALLQNAVIYHVHALHTHKTPHFYCSGAGINYYQFNM